MLDLKLIRDNPELVRAGIAAKKSTASVDEILSLDQKRRELLHQSEQLKGERNKATAEIARKKKAGENADAEVASMRQVGDKIAELDEHIRLIEADLEEKQSWFPNLPHESVPRGMDESANVVVREWGEIPKPSFTVLPHWEIGEKLGVLDLHAAAKISGSGFYVLKGNGARLQRALISYMLDLHREAGFIEVNVPHVVTPNTMFGTGQLPKLAEDMYHLKDDDLYLIPTAEVPVTNLYKQEILASEQLPILHACYTPCFRREAGAAGKDTRGMIRVHQFDKVEIVKIVEPENSYDELESLVRQAEKVLHGLKLPYRVLSLCTGDLSFAAAKCYDLELWCAGIGKYLEISSCSNFEDFQARRMKCRVRNKNKEVYFPHTLNGSGLALARLIPAILENYQQPDGTVVIPEVLRPYLGGLEKLS
jgi:seryl-tRNA synthetase